MKKQTKEKTGRGKRVATHLKAKRRLILVWVLAVLIVGQLLFDVVVIWRHTTFFPQSEPAVATTIFRSIDDLYTSAPIEAETGRLYVANARLVVPASGSNDILYAYSPADEVTPASISFTTRQMISYGQSQTVGAYYDSFAKNTFSINREHKAFEALFAELPSLQACARGVQIFEAAQNENNLTDQGTKLLNDGRTLHFYTEQLCQQKTQLTNLLEVLKGIESY